MRGLLLCCLVALVACESSRYDVNLNPKKTYRYQYEGQMNFGLGQPDLAESGVKIKCKVKIAGASDESFTLQVSELDFAEFNGFRDKSSFNSSPELTQRLAAQLVKPFMFNYTSGYVSDIWAAAEVSDTAVNFVRAILDFLQVTVKTTHRIYQLEEIGIYGKCQSNYVAELIEETQEMNIIQVVDIGNCREKAAMYTGMAAAVLDESSKLRGESVISTVRYVYTVEPTAEGGLIKRARGLERQHFSPFNVKGGSFKMEATKELVLLGVSDEAGSDVSVPVKSKGDLVYKFVNAEANVPITMQNLEDPQKKAQDLIKHLADANAFQIDSAAADHIIKLYQLLRVMPFEKLEAMWKELKGNDEYRRWFLDTIVEINDARILEFLELRFKTGDLTPNEAWQTFLVTVNHLQSPAELVEMAKVFLNMPFSKSSETLWNTVVLSYGSLVYKHCAHETPCPLKSVQPLLDLALQALTNRDNTEMVLALKALGNAGHPGSIKTILRFLPEVAAKPVDLPPRVQSAAVQAMRLIAARDPHTVQEITLSLFLQRRLSTELRMLAFMILFETKPNMALVSTVTAHLQEEQDLHVASFAYSYFRSCAGSNTPDNQVISIACSVAEKILAPQFAHLSYFYSKAERMDWFDDNYLIGTATEVFMLRKATNIFPTRIMTNGKFYFIGRVLQLIEFGIHADGLTELFGSSIPGFKGDFQISDFKAIFDVLQKWESLPADKPVISAFSRASGQEWFFADIKKELYGRIIKSIGENAGNQSPVWVAIEKLQRGLSWRWTKPFLAIEVRYFQATTLGFSLEISKYYQTVTGIIANATATVKPPLKTHLHELLTSEISLETDGFAGFTKDFWMFYGINTELFQCGSEYRSQMPLSIPWKFSAKINHKEKKYEFDFHHSQKEIEVFAFSSNVNAVSRTPETTKTTPMIPNDTDEVRNTQNRLPPNMWHPKDKVCAESRIYDLSVCVEYDVGRQNYHKDYPLYYFLGYTRMALKVKPAQTTRAVDRLHFEVNASPSGPPLSAHQLIETLRRLSEEVTGGPRVSSDPASSNSDLEGVFSIKAWAMRANDKIGGYEAEVYYTSQSPSCASALVSQVGENTNWKMCVSANLNMSTQAKAHIKWGAECQPYEMSVKASTAPLSGSKPTLTAKVDWTKIPQSMADMGRRYERYMLAMAYYLGFYQHPEGNARQEVSASVVADSADSVDVMIEFPEYTVYRQGIPFSFPPGTSETQQ